MTARGLLALAAAACWLAAAPAAVAVPGVPQPPVPVFSEDFENVSPATTPALITAYVGAPPASQTYTADAAWVTDTGCNGIVTSQASADLTQCAFSSGLEALTAALGTFNGTSAASNHAWASMVANSPPAELVELETASPIALAAPSRFIAASVNVAAHCQGAPPLLTLYVLDGATAIAAFTAPYSPCPTAALTTSTYTSPRAALVSGPAAGLRIVNAAASTPGNGHGLDDVKLLDATPKLDLAFTSPVAPGATSRLTATITNTSELAEKAGWSFTDALGGGLSIAALPNLATTCAGASVDALPGATRLAASGTLAAGVASCAVQVDVTAAPGDYANGPQDITSRTGLDPPPAAATVTFQAPPPPPAAPDAKQGTSVTIARSLGTVRVKVPGSASYVDVGQLQEVPLGSRIDTRKGRVTLTAEVDATTGATPVVVVLRRDLRHHADQGRQAVPRGDPRRRDVRGLRAGIRPTCGTRHRREPDPVPVRRQAQQAQGPPPVGPGQRQLPHRRAPLHGDRPRHVVARRGPLRRHAHARAPGSGRRPRPAPAQDDQAARRQALHVPRQGAVSMAARLALGLAVALVALAAAGLAQPGPADARIATSGSGRFLDTIDWFEWGTPFAALSIAGPQTRTHTTTIGGVNLDVSCVLTKLGGLPLAYRPGDWPGDALDELYAIDGPGSTNTLIAGISTPGDESNLTTTFDFACAALLGGRPLRLGGIVVADAEQSVSPERVQATIASRATWRIIDRLRSPGCTASTAASRTDTAVTNTLVLAGTKLCATGPAVVAYADGATSGTAVAYSPAFGRSAVALGVWVPVDGGDAPASYGQAGHALAVTLSGGGVPVNDPSPVSDPAFELATPTAPPTRLGASVDPGGVSSADAGGDDDAGSNGMFGADDDETGDPPAAIEVVAGGSLAQPAIACTGPGFVAGWIDFDASGSFDADERSQTAECAAGAVDLAWAVPADAAAQAQAFERLRIAASASDVAGPTGFAASGEVEDHALALALASAAPPPVGVREPSGPPGPPPLLTAVLAVPATVGSSFAATATPEPHQGESVAIEASTGTVRVQVPGSARYVDVAGLGEVPLGSRIDARRGKVTVTVEVDARTGATQTGTFFSGIFVVTQTPAPKPVLVLTLAGGSFSGCSGRTAARRSILGAATDPIPFTFAARKRSKRKVRRLWGKGKGDFRSEGLRSAATVRGTYWLVEDRCDGTYTRVREGTVDVRDFRLRKTIRLRAGKRSRYLAKAA